MTSSAELLRESEERYRDLIESSHDLLQSITPDGRFDFVNKAWFETLEYTEADLPNLNLYDLIHPDDHARCKKPFRGVLAGDSLKVNFVTKSGRTIPVEGNATGRFVGEVCVATHAFFRDITERRRAEKLSEDYQRSLEQEVRKRTAELVQSEKLATLGRLSAGMARAQQSRLLCSTRCRATDSGVCQDAEQPP